MENLKITINHNDERTVSLMSEKKYHTPKPILLSLEGSIGSGKSTLINKLRERNIKWHFIDEPVSTWQALKNEDGEDLLQVFYKDIRRYSYTFQNCALLSRAINIQKKIEEWKIAAELNPEEAQHNVFITERCLETDFHVFAQMLRDDKKMDAMEWDLYKMWYDYIKTLSTPLTGIVYLYTPPEICAQRIKIRARTGEDMISATYLASLDKYQRGWLAHEKIPIMHYDNFGTDAQKNMVEDVENFVEEFIC